jgi:Zinc dependent phospholipase C
VLAPRSASAYSVLAHESNIDALWDSQIRPALLAKYPGTSAERLRLARAYAYGGSTVQDLGYFPFGSKFFTNLLHYVKTGQFIETMVREARDVDELAFAIGALCHYASDSEGHAIAVNRAVPLMYPKLRAKFGDSVPYEVAPKQHVLVEFAFDVLLVAHGGYTLQAYHDFIGFKVSKPLLERAFRKTYGLEMKDLFFDDDLAIGTYRHAVASMIPDVTKVAWEQKQEEILKTTPGALRQQFVLALPRAAYEQEYGKDYKKPGILARFIGVLAKIVPKVGPFRPLAFKVPPPEAERLFLESLARTRTRYATTLQALRAGRLDLPDINFDTGKPAVAGEYPLADETLAELKKRLNERNR